MHSEIVSCNFTTMDAGFQYLAVNTDVLFFGIIPDFLSGFWNYFFVGLLFGQWLIDQPYLYTGVYPFGYITVESGISTSCKICNFDCLAVTRNLCQYQMSPILCFAKNRQLIRWGIQVVLVAPSDPHLQWCESFAFLYMPVAAFALMRLADEMLPSRRSLK